MARSEGGYWVTLLLDPSLILTEKKGIDPDLTNHTSLQLKEVISPGADVAERNFMTISSDQCRSVEGDLRNTLNVIGTLVMRAEGFYGAST